MKILLAACNAKYIHSNLAVFNLKSYTRDYDNNVVLREYTINQQKDDILKDIYKADNSWNIGILRYFNPVGAHESGLIGEDPNGIPNNLMPYIAQVGAGKLDHLNVFGNDYPTRDGTGVRDYIHVVDLAKGHIKAIEKAMKSDGVNIYNLGTGNGYSVLEIVHAFEKVNGIPIPYEIKPRRDGDIAECYADPTKALNELGWKAELGIEEMCRSSWKFTRGFFGK